jgi:hypothetical protein
MEEPIILLESRVSRNIRYIVVCTLTNFCPVNYVLPNDSVWRVILSHFHVANLYFSYSLNKNVLVSRNASFIKKLC